MPLRQARHLHNGPGDVKIFDSHIHIFADHVVQNVRQKTGLVAQLKLQAGGAGSRNSPEKLKTDMALAGVQGALMLPTANAAGVRKTNAHCLRTAASHPFIATAGTLHPHASQLAEELAFLRRNGVRVIKLCSFSQGFAMDAPRTLEMFDALQAANADSDAPFAVVLDTLYNAHRHFGTRPEFNTTPRHLARLADLYPGINFIGAHMGGLDAPFEKINRHLTPRSNLYLDTSNAAHTLAPEEFCDLVTLHGPGHVLFGTDWPWFTHHGEVARIDRLLGMAGLNEEQKSRVFSDNIIGLLGRKGKF